MTMTNQQKIQTLIDAGDSQTAVMAITVLNVARQAAEDGWDRPARLWTLRRDMPPTELADALAEAGALAQLMTVTRMPVEIAVGGGAELAFVLRNLAKGIRTHWDGGPEPDFVAWAVSYEAWMATAPPGDAQAMASVRADADAHRLHLRADRVEVRIVTAIDRAGTFYQAVHKRGALEPELWLVQAGDEPTFEGRIPEALATLMDATP